MGMKRERTALEQMRTRWRRWLGNKTRAGYPHWVTLLNSNWLGFVDRVFTDCGLGGHGITFRSPQEDVKNIYAKAIDHATMEHLRKLDSLYAENRWLGH